MSNTTANSAPTSDKAKAWQEELAKVATSGAVTGLLIGLIAVPILAGLTLGLVFGLPGAGLLLGFGSALLGAFSAMAQVSADEGRKSRGEPQRFLVWEEKKIDNLNPERNKFEAFFIGLLLCLPVASPLLWPASFIIKGNMKAAENAGNAKTSFLAGIKAMAANIFTSPIAQERKQAEAAAKAAQKAKLAPMQIAVPDTTAPATTLAAPAIAVAAPVISEPPIRPARSTIGNKGVTVRLPGAAPGEGA